jgi:DNA-binding MarR family transcriptional regulator
MSQTTPSTKQDNALIALRQIIRATELNSRVLAKQSGLNPSQLILLNLIERKKQISPGEAAKTMSISQGTVTVLAEKLAVKGFLARRKSEEDKRKFILTLTDQGLAAINSAPDMLQERFLYAFGKMESWEQSYLVGALERVALMLDADELDAAPVLDIGQISTLPTPVKKETNR